MRFGAFMLRTCWHGTCSTSRKYPSGIKSLYTLHDFAFSNGQRKIRSAVLAAVALLLVLGLLVTSWVRAAAVPILVERYTADIDPDQLASLLHGDFDTTLKIEPDAAMVSSQRGTSWYRVRLVNDWVSPRQPALMISAANAITVHAYSPPDYIGAEYGLHDSESAWRRIRHALVVPLGLGWRATTPVYLRVDSSVSAVHAFSVNDLHHAQELELDQAHFDVIWPVAQFTLLLAALLTLRPLGDRLLWPYLGQTLGLTVLLALQAGIGFAYWPTSLLDPLGVRANGFMASLVMVFAIVFARTFLDLPRRAPRLAQAGSVAIGLLLVFALLCALPPIFPDGLLLRCLGALALVISLLVWGSGWFAGWRGQRGAGGFIIAWAPTFLVMLFNAAHLILEAPRPAQLIAAQPVVLTIASLGLLYVLATRMTRCRFDPQCAVEMRERDLLTGALNRSATVAALRGAFVGARYAKRSLSVIVVEPDSRLLTLAAAQGRSATDMCLHSLMGCLGEELRDADSVGRVGDERLLAVLPGASEAQARALAARVAARATSCSLHWGGMQQRLAAVFGVATLAQEMLTPDELLAHADTALQAAQTA